MTTASNAEEKVRAVLANPSPETLAEIRAHVWTGHNIPLSETQSTLGPEHGLIGDDARTVTIKKLIRRFAGRAPIVRILDLGSLEGGLSFEMAREGWDVTGVEGRPSNFQKAELIRRHFGLENLRFECRDVKTLHENGDGTYDVVLCCGLLYHLDDPFAFLQTLRDITTGGGLLFVDTHVAPEDPLAVDGVYASHLSELTTLGRYEGRWFSEPAAGSVRDQQWSAVSNERSFWPSHRSLIRGVYHAGFETIFELFGMFEIDGEFALRDRYSRVWLACLRRL